MLILESTYGDKNHQGRTERQQTLENILRKTLDDKGVTIVPAFSLGRTQELLYELNGIFERLQNQEGRSIMKAVDVIVDSPMASKFTELYKGLEQYWDDEAQKLLKYGDQPLVFDNLTTVGDHSEHMSTLDYLDKSGVPAVIIAGSGMCSGGRVTNYLKRFLGESNTDIVFVGYQGRGTPGREIQAKRDYVKLDGQDYAIRADVHSISGYSAHADQSNLLDFIGKMQQTPGEIVLVHGEEAPKAVLAKKIEKLGIAVR